MNDGYSENEFMIKTKSTFSIPNFLISSKTKFLKF